MLTKFVRELLLGLLFLAWTSDGIAQQVAAGTAHAVALTGSGVGVVWLGSTT